MTQTLAGDLLDRGVPDVTSTEGLSDVLAAEIDHLSGQLTRWIDPGTTVHPALRARALVAAGDYDAGRAEMASWIPGELVEWPVHAVAAGIWAATRVGDLATVEILESRLGPSDDAFLVGGDVPLGPVALFEGIAAGARGDAERAVGVLEAAVRVGDARAPVWGARARLELARVVLGIPWADRRMAESALFSARMFFAAGGYRYLETVATRLAEPTPASSGAEPGLAHLVPGETWTVGYGVQAPAQVPDLKGLRALHHLVRHPGQVVPAVVLDRIVEGDADPDPSLVGLLAAGWEPNDPTSAWTAEVRERLADDRIRSRISKLVRRTIARLDEVHPFLASHLAGSVTTGYACRYEPGHDVRWRC